MSLVRAGRNSSAACNALSWSNLQSLPQRTLFLPIAAPAPPGSSTTPFVYGVSQQSISFQNCKTVGSKAAISSSGGEGANRNSGKR